LQQRRCIARLLALNALVLYAIYRVAMAAVSFFPVIEKKHRHRDWDRLNRDGWLCETTTSHNSTSTCRAKINR
jgi:hypothetical protein